MGMCKSCGEVFGTSELTKGICKTCGQNSVVENKTEETTLNTKLMKCKVCEKEISKNAKQCPYCGESYENVTIKEEEMSPEKYVRETGKSRITSFLLTLLLGPLGLLYSSIVGGIIMIILTIGIAGATAGVGAIVMWGISIVLGDSFTYNYNKRLLAQAKFMK